MDMNMDLHSISSAAPTASASPTSPSESPTSYFSYGEHSTTILAHIVLMILAWCFVLPAAVLLSVARSRLALPSQFVFLLFNTIGLLFGIIYNSQTPDLYENNAHHKIGWIVTGVFTVQVFLALVFVYDGRGKPREFRATFLPVATGEDGYRAIGKYCPSRDSQGSQPLSPSIEAEAEDLEQADEKTSGLRWWLFSFTVPRFLFRVPGMVSNRALRLVNTVYNVIDRIILPFGFIAISTGAVTYGGIFHGIEVFNGVAHFIKGGIFFWYGVLTLGRFIGAWADLGWAWNKKPPAYIVGWKAKVPSGEFVESFVIWLYGVTNVFLEHLSGWGQEWTPRDLEHVAISIMFFGGGLAGMLFESRRIREALNNTLFPRSPYQEPDCENWKLPKSQGVPLNPMPALIIFLLGIMMSSHHQSSMTSTMVHKQWGSMLVGFAIARGMTYILLFLRPPTSYLPGRPPTEIVTAFCLMAGGLIFMLSASDVVEAMEFYEVDAMFAFTVGMGFTAFIMSLVVLAIAIKAWAVRRGRGRTERY
ncbi:hypothetical protein ASPVEDRAFT_145055 [Aspergillus versicolor CBS 583.65]|uniref:Protein YTP1-like C-terminal domain-containing protein n=1 Tax=Aspergillus versicolor CBS 583.65 TaxID=1036611 RepID=A0A1L9Q4Y9_ASPVE|nr:uncharacterized protein ASPVEDRAFT_145055 [Aspergillus versicolor CBS 583.65]OJJ08843.1 hypothetical protein ASPVEDRAFT_145055 [Aspergillus versicolor CBS 583.65]